MTLFRDRFAWSLVAGILALAAAISVFDAITARREAFRSESHAIVLADELPVRAGAVLGNLESIALSGHAVRNNVIDAHRSQTITASGWLVDADARAPGSAIVLRIDEQGPYSIARYRIPRADVAAAYHEPAYAESGFTAQFPLGAVAPGRHTLTFLAVNHDGTQAYPAFQRYEIRVR